MGMPAAIPLYTVDDLEHFPEDGNRYELLDGVLLVTPQASSPHQIVAQRLATAFSVALGKVAVVTSPGAVIHGVYTELQPDVLVDPPRPLSTEWKHVTEHWLAVEIYSRSSRIYDREFKVPEYLRRGLNAVWLVDLRAQSVEVFTPGAEPVVEQQMLRWSPPGQSVQVEIALAELFRE